MDKFREELQKKMAIRYDTELEEIMDLIERSYQEGVVDGKANAKAEIINLISGGKHETEHKHQDQSK
jgi:hypothetical protein